MQLNHTETRIYKLVFLNKISNCNNDMGYTVKFWCFTLSTSKVEKQVEIIKM